MKKHPLLLRSLIFIGIPILCGSFFIGEFLKGGLEDFSGVWFADSINSRVEVTKDNLDVVYIQADSLEDAYFAVGFSQARDRLWQMEMQRRIVKGQLAEVFGAEVLESDVWFRSLQLYDYAKMSWPLLSEDAQDSLTAYANGVNYYISQAKDFSPHFSLYNVTPEPWQVEDSLAWLKFFAFSLSGNMGRETSLFVASDRLGSSTALKLFEPDADDSFITCEEPCVDETLKGILSNLDFMGAKLKMSPENSGSNAWVVAGDAQKGYGATLANDPHLGLQIPSPWYAISSSTGTHKVAGMSLVGLPIVVFGRNKDISWGGTSMMADVQDLFLEKVVPSEPKYYISHLGIKKFEQSVEYIDIKAKFPSFLHRKEQPEKLVVRQSINGPIINRNNGTFAMPVSLRWPGFDRDDLSYEALYRLNFADSWESFNQALELLKVPAMNMLYADRKNNIGYVGAGAIPVREGRDGSFPVASNRPKNQWKKYIPFDEMPRKYNPESGYIISANNKVVADNFPYFISNDWADSSRALRIEELLKGRQYSDVESVVEWMKAIQADQLDLSIKPLIEELMNVKSSSEDVKQVLSVLREWDGSFTKDRTEPFLFNSIVRELREHLFSSILLGDRGQVEDTRWAKRLMNDLGPRDLSHILKLLRTNSIQGEGITFPSSHVIIEESILEAIHKAAPFGSVIDTTLKESQFAVYQPIPKAYSKNVLRVLERRIPNGGSKNTVDVAASYYSPTEGYNQNFGASFRQIINMSNGKVEHLYMNSTGQSENPFSEHYDDMFVLFHERQYREMSFPNNYNFTLTVFLPAKGKGKQ